MRGSHYGADYRWFTRFIGDDVNIPQQIQVDQEEVDKVLAERGIQAKLDEDIADVDALQTDPPDLQRVLGTSRAGARERPSSGPYRPGSLMAAMWRARLRQQGGEGRSSGPQPEGSSIPSVLGDDRPPKLTPEIQRLAKMIEESVSPRELSKYSFEHLMAAFRAAKMNPGTGAKIVQSWGRGKGMSPEEVVAAVKKAKDEWLVHADTHRKPPPSPLLMSPKDWNYDASVAAMLNQRDNVGQGPKDIDRERLVLLRRLMASFSGQANYGFQGAEAVAEAASNSDLISS